MNNSIIGLGADHAGFGYKEQLVKELEQNDYPVLDIGTYSEAPVDYPDIAQKMAETLLDGRIDKGILICGSGVGICVATNKFPGIRAAVCHDSYSAHQGVEHDNMNILCLGERIIGIELAKELAQIFLQARFSNEKRHRRRVGKIIEIESNHLKRQK